MKALGDDMKLENGMILHLEYSCRFYNVGWMLIFLCKIQISEFLKKMSDIKETRLDECMVNH